MNLSYAGRESRDDLKYKGECAQVVCKYCGFWHRRVGVLEPVTADTERQLYSASAFFNSVSRPDSAMINFSCLLERLFSQSVLIVSMYEIN